MKGESGVDIENWKNKLPEKEREPVEVILNRLEDSELTNKEQAEVISALHSIIQNILTIIGGICIRICILPVTIFTMKRRII